MLDVYKNLHSRFITQWHKKKNSNIVAPPLIPRLGRQSRGSSELETSLVYRATFRTARATQTNLVFKTNQTNQEIQTASYQTKCLSIEQQLLLLYLMWLRERVYDGVEGLTAKAGSWLIRFNHNPVSKKTGNGSGLQRLLSHPQWWILSRKAPLTKGFTSNQKKVTKERYMFKYIILSGRFYNQSVTFWPK